MPPARRSSRLAKLQPEQQPAAGRGAKRGRSGGGRAKSPAPRAAGRRRVSKRAKKPAATAAGPTKKKSKQGKQGKQGKSTKEIGLGHAWENRLRGRGFKCIAGVDEAGRGPLAGQWPQRNSHAPTSTTSGGRPRPSCPPRYYHAQDAVFVPRSPTTPRQLHSPPTLQLHLTSTSIAPLSPTSRTQAPWWPRPA